MKTLPVLHFIAYCVIKSIRHPKTRIAYFYCSNCRIRFPASSAACPKCGEKVEHSPERKEHSPVPWYGAVMVIVIGVICWVVGAAVPVPGLDEAGRALVYVPLGSLFGMSLHP
ncbi:hypothetical protein ES703_92154 [subsurface metagenome]